MQSCIVSISEIMKDPNLSLSAKHWCERKATEEEVKDKVSKVKEELKQLRSER